jgi:hypothetical protein
MTRQAARRLFRELQSLMATLALHCLMPAIKGEAGHVVFKFAARDFPCFRRVTRRALEPNFSVRRFLRVSTSA